MWVHVKLSSYMPNLYGTCQAVMLHVNQSMCVPCCQDTCQAVRVRFKLPMYMSSCQGTSQFEEYMSCCQGTCLFTFFRLKYTLTVWIATSQLSWMSTVTCVGGYAGSGVLMAVNMHWASQSLPMATGGIGQSIHREPRRVVLEIKTRTLVRNLHQRSS